MINNLMKQSIDLAKQAFCIGEVPVGAIIYSPSNQQILASTINQVETLKDPSAHAEILGIREACRRLDSKFLNDAELYVTLEPCTMCLQALCFARIKTIYFGAYDYKRGAISTHSGVMAKRMNNFIPEIYGGIMESECANLLSSFFSQLR